MDSDFLEIRADTGLSFEITFMRDGQKQIRLLRMDGGDWQVTDERGDGWKNIGQGRIGWHEALKRVLKMELP